MRDCASTMEAITATATGTLLRLRVQPRARLERLEGLRDGYIRLRLTAAPVDGAANMACIAFLARTLGVNRTQVRLQAGVKSRDKLVHITGLTPAQVAAALGLVSS
ncbi:MAG TPA: DUF167 domain-containing protein [Candidatus Tectomicrobia bacterium]